MPHAYDHAIRACLFRKCAVESSLAVTLANEIMLLMRSLIANLQSGVRDIASRKSPRIKACWVVYACDRAAPGARR